MDTDNSIAAFSPDPSRLLASPTVTSNSSPGAAAVKTFGVITNGPRTIVVSLERPTAASATATAMMRS